MVEKRLKEARKKIGFNSRDDFANALDMPFSTIRTYEQGKVSIPHTFLIKINEQYNISIDWLLTGRGEMFFNQNNSFSNISNSNVVNNSTININSKDYNDEDDIKDIIELLKYAPKQFLHKLREKLKQIKNVTEDIF